MSFDLEEFMNQATEPMADQFENIPEGEFPFIIDADPKQLTPREIKGESDKGAYHFFQLELNCICQDEEVKKKLGRERPICRIRVNLDIDQNGKLETGPNKNVALGQLRTALGQNAPGWSPRQLLGAGPFLGKVKHTSDKKDPQRKYADIVRTAPIRH